MLQLTPIDEAAREEAASAPILEASGLVKSFGSRQVLSGVDLSVNPGAIVGLVGANGSGKSTLIQTLLGLLRPTFGEARLFGEDSWNLSPGSKERLGHAAQWPHAFRWMTVGQMVRYVGSFYANFDPSLAEALMSRWSLRPRERCARLSGGQTQRLELVLAMSHRPDLLLLDEPAAALDPAGRRDLLELLLHGNRLHGQTTLLSTHITSDLERVASHVAILHANKIRFFGELDNIKDRAKRVTVTAGSPAAEAIAAMGLIRRRRDGRHVVLTVSEFDPRVASPGATRVDVEDLNLEEMFLEVCGAD